MQREQAQRSQFENRDRNNFAQRGDNNRPDFNRGNDNRGGNDRGNFGRSDNNRPDFNRGNNDRRDFGRNDRFDNRPGGYRNDNRWTQYNRAFNAPYRFQFRGPVYQRPQGFYYRRWTYGDFMPSLFWGARYWIDDFRFYGLMSPPPGTVWVRYGDDAVLIDRYTGEVIQVEYGIFY